MILGLSRQSWIEQLTVSQLNEYFQMIDKLVVVVESPDDEWVTEDKKIHYRFGDYEEILNTLNWWSICKAYPRKTLFSINFSLVEIPDGCTANSLKRRWVRELQSHGVL